MASSTQGLIKSVTRLYIYCGVKASLSMSDTDLQISEALNLIGVQAYNSS